MTDEQQTPPPQWMARLTERDNAQIAHAREYAGRFSGAGVPGASQFLLIAHLADLLDEREHADRAAAAVFRKAMGPIRVGWETGDT